MSCNFMNDFNASAYHSAAEGIVATAKTGSLGQIQTFAARNTRRVFTPFLLTQAELLRRRNQGRAYQPALRGFFGHRRGLR